ncbi:substrate-binding domain-containing protein [Streptomyces marokkonensis]|uniref:Substrate-binding domain-containing protein n=1 Tax=Streptomyces marokkonensis TaxID=324855 RepID=A0ABW6QA67_9ACTN
MTPFDPRGLVNRALLVGVSGYDFTGPPHGVPGGLPAVGHNLDRMREALARGRVFGEREIRALPSPLLTEFSQELQRSAKEAEGLLLVYFAGHGAVPSGDDELYLQMRDARVIPGKHTVFDGAEKFSDLLARVLATSPAQRIVVMLDCCFAGNAARVWERFEDKQHVLLLMSVQANHRIDAGDPRTPTPFTTELAALLAEEGDTRLSALADRLLERMAALGHRTVRDEAWEPQLRAELGMDVLLRAGGGQAPPPPLPESRATEPPASPESGATEPPASPESGATEPPASPESRATEPPASPESRELPEPAPPRRPVRALLSALLGPLRRAGAALVGLFRPTAPPRPLRWTVFRIGLPAVLVTGLLGLGLYGPLRFIGGDDTPCAPPLELRVLTDPDLEPTVRAAADAYLTSGENTTGDGCRRTGVTVYSAGSSDVVGALRSRTGAWHEPHDEDVNPQRDIGPQPDIWIPASRADVDRAEDGRDTDAVAALAPDEEPLAYSPVVLAVPHAIASEALDDRTGHTLTELIDGLKARDEDAAVRRPDPEFTDVGLLATLGLYGADARAVSRGERLVAQPGPPSPTAAELLCTLPDDDAVDHRTAALVPEFLLRSGVGCDRTTRSPRSAQYPRDVPGVEPVFVRVRWRGADRDEADRDASVAGFRDWLTGEGGREVFARDGFRSAYGRELLDQERVAEGVLRAPSPLDESAGRDATARTLRAYQDAGGPGRVLFLLDSSGSMAALWEGPSGGPGLLRQSLGGLGGEDEYGVWTVAGTGDRRYETLLDLAPHSRAGAERAVGTGARVRDAEADPHAALLAALEEMEERGDGDRRPQLIVHITDGEDNDRLTGARLTEVLTAARTSGVPVTVVSLQSGGCDRDRPDHRIADVSGGRCLDAGDDLGAALHDEVARTGTGEG